MRIFGNYSIFGCGSGLGSGGFRSFRLGLTAMLALVLALPCFAQGPQSPEEQEKQMRENIEKTVERYEEEFKLEVWQSFFVDSILTHDFKALSDEIASLSQAKVENPDLYIMVQDKWMEKIYQSMRKVLNDEQWAVYLKQGAAREKKARDKRETKRKK